MTPNAAGTGPRSRHMVGYRSGVVDDESRRDWDDHGPRPCSWAAWYPTGASGAETELLAGPPGSPLFRLGPVIHDAPLLGAGSLRTVLLSHGTGGTAQAFGWLGMRLARRGFVAIAANHHGNTAREPYRAEGLLCWWERARDLTVLLDALSGRGPFAGHLDTSRTLVAGFSLGAHTGLSLLGAISDMSLFQAHAEARGWRSGPREFPDLPERLGALLDDSAVFRSAWDRQSWSYEDQRVRSALLLAPAPPIRALTPASLSRVAAPTSILVGDADREAPADEAAWLHEHLPGSSLDVLRSNVPHQVFLSEPTEIGRLEAPDLCVDPPGVDRVDAHALAERLALRLLHA